MHARAAKIIITTEKNEALLQAGRKSLEWHYKYRLVDLTHKWPTDSVLGQISSLLSYQAKHKTSNDGGKNRLNKSTVYCIKDQICGTSFQIIVERLDLT